MNESSLPLIIEAEELAQALPEENLLLVTVCGPQVYLAHHVPGSLLIQPGELVSGIEPATGKLPSAERLSELFSRVGLTADRHVVAIDDEGGGWAGRLIWTLDVLGHQRYSFLNGGVLAWAGAGLPLESGNREGKARPFEARQQGQQGDTHSPESAPERDTHRDLTTRGHPPSRPLEGDTHRAQPKGDTHFRAQKGDTHGFEARIDRSPIADKQQVLDQLDDPDSIVWDARSAEEYAGIRVTARRNGHIPGAVNLDWLELLDRRNHFRLKPLDVLRPRLAELGIVPGKKIITHCQTHHRSGLSYLVGKALDLDIRAYDGSWSEWGNAGDTPIEN